MTEKNKIAILKSRIPPECPYTFVSKRVHFILFFASIVYKSAWVDELSPGTKCSIHWRNVWQNCGGIHTCVFCLFVCLFLSLSLVSDQPSPCRERGFDSSVRADWLLAVRHSNLGDTLIPFALTEQHYSVLPTYSLFIASMLSYRGVIGSSATETLLLFLNFQLPGDLSRARPEIHWAYKLFVLIRVVSAQSELWRINFFCCCCLDGNYHPCDIFI